MGLSHDYTDCTELLLSHTEGTESIGCHCLILFINMITLIPTERLDSCVCPYIENYKFICICL